jgi:hypothetical protein
MSFVAGLDPVLLGTARLIRRVETFRVSPKISKLLGSGTTIFSTCLFGRSGAVQRVHHSFCLGRMCSLLYSTPSVVGRRPSLCISGYLVKTRLFGIIICSSLVLSYRFWWVCFYNFHYLSTYSSPFMSKHRLVHPLKLCNLEIHKYFLKILLLRCPLE